MREDLSSEDLSREDLSCETADEQYLTFFELVFDVMKQTQGGHTHIALGLTDIPPTRRPRAPHPGRERGE